MIELISELVTFLSKDTLRVDEVVAKVGTVASNPAIPLPLEISPTLPHIQSAWLARDPASGLPYVLSLKLAEEATMTPGELKSLLGNFSLLTADRGRPPQIIFYPKAKETSGWIVVIADLEKGSGSMEDARISNIRFRRDTYEDSTDTNKMK